MPDDLLPSPIPETPPAPEPPARGTRIVCEFCGCELDPRGNVLRRGQAARTYLDQEDDLKKVHAQVDILKADNAELSRQLEAARTPKKRGFLDL